MRVAVAGTFGPLHDGHRALFETALELGADGVVVGLTSDDLAPETRSEPRPIPTATEREKAVRAALADLDEWGRDVELRRIEDEYDVVTTDPTLDALVVSPETGDELRTINGARREAGIDPLVGIVVPFVLAEDGERISSTRIVKGEIDEHGNRLSDGGGARPSSSG